MIDSYLFSLLSGWLEYVYKYTLSAASCILLSYMHVVIWMTFIPYMHMDLRSFETYLFLKQVTKKGIVDSSRDCFANGDNFSIFKTKFYICI